MKKRVGVLMGGPSCERAISIRSGKAVCSALEHKGIDAVPVELAPSPTINGYRELVIQKIRLSSIDLAFVALHGGFGEDGGIQRILEDMGIPYTGSRVDASRSGMDKIISKHIFKSNNILIPRYRIIHKRVLDNSCDAQVYFKELGQPLVIKPSAEGSSIGLSIVDSVEDFHIAVKGALKYSDSVIVEEYVQGREVTVGILQDRPLPVVEIIPKKRFFDFEAKYEKGLAEYRVPAAISKEEHDVCQRIALSAHNALGARFFSRVDMILNKDSIPVALEVNTIPGLTQTSLLPKAALAAGIDYDELVLKILESTSW